MFTFPTAPLEWTLALFPLPREGARELSTDWVVQVAHGLLDEAERIGDGAHYGPTLHWMHVLKTLQRPDGAWPAFLDAESGRGIGDQTTTSPATYMERVARRLDSSEFDYAVALARRAAEGGMQNAKCKVQNAK